MPNPFDVTKAVDFSNQEIEEYFVDLEHGGFRTFADPTSPMPTFLVGGKGGGRTHVLRRYSFDLQCIRHGDDLLSGIAADGYVGLYFRCGGLNSSRFVGKGQSGEAWSALFSYYMELQLASLTVDVVRAFLELGSVRLENKQEQKLVAAIETLFLDSNSTPNGGSAAGQLGALAHSIRQRQRLLDRSINDAAFTRRVDASIAANPGALVFGVPREVARHVPALSTVRFAFLIDEFENLSEDQQKFVNTLVREKELPTTFLIGSRLYGIRTHETLAAAENNRDGSEFELELLEDRYRTGTANYRQFCERIVARRIEKAGLATHGLRRVDDLFATPDGARFPDLEKLALKAATADDGSVRQPWFDRFRRSLQKSKFASDAESLIKPLRVVDNPLLEKFGLFLLYREWARGSDLERAVEQVAVNLDSIEDGRPSVQLARTFKHYKYDLYAQLRHDLHLDQEYYGFPEIVQMSGFLPRNLLVILKQITRWAEFEGEELFGPTGISVASQTAGINAASTWYLSDAKGLGELGDRTESAIRRLGSVFRAARFSDKPSEVQCSSFSFPVGALSPDASQCLKSAVDHSFLIDVGNRKERNSHRIEQKYQLNPMLAPFFELSTARRGEMRLSASQMNVLFGDDDSVSARSLERALVGHLNAPFAHSGSDALF